MPKPPPSPVLRSHRSVKIMLANFKNSRPAMPLSRTAIALLLMLAVAACSSTPETILSLREVRSTVPAEAMRPCDPPTSPPMRGLSQGETVTFWNRDRVALVQCEKRRDAAVKAAGQ